MKFGYQNTCFGENDGSFIALINVIPGRRYR